MLGHATVLFSHNPYTYCYNYVINACDPSGRDIIVITDESLPTHTSLLIQDLWGSWHYFYWGASADGGSSAMIVNAFSNQPGNGNMIYTKLKGLRVNKKDDTTTLSNINNCLHDSNIYTGTYTKLTYISCFSFPSHLKANELTKNQSADTYNLFTRNCAQVSLEVLGPSLFFKYTSLINILFEKDACTATLESDLYDVGSKVLPIWIHDSLDTYLDELENGGINP